MFFRKSPQEGSKRNPALYAIIFGILIFLGLAIPLGVQALTDWAELYQLGRFGVPRDAIVEQKWIHQAGGGIAYIVNYTFEIDPPRQIKIV